MSKNVIEDVFIAYGRPQRFVATPFLACSEEDKKTYFLGDGDFLIRLWDEERPVVFKVFLDDKDPFKWVTDAGNVIIDRESVEVIGSIIESYFD